MTFQANMVEVRAADLSGTALHWAVAAAKYGKVLKASNIALDLAHARLRTEASGHIKAAIERMSQK